MFLIRKPWLGLAVALTLATGGSVTPQQVPAQSPGVGAGQQECLVLDPAHSNATVEGRLVLAVATGVAGHLRTMGIETELTRSGDEAASTADRLRQAVGSGCRLLVSLHLEAGPSTSTAAQVRLYHRRDDGQAAMMSTRLAQSLAARLGAPPGIEAIVNHPLFGAPGTVLVLSLGSLTDPGIFERVRSTEFTLAVAEATAAAVR